MKKKEETRVKKFQVDISDFEELQDAIVEYFILMSEILDKEDFQIQTLTLDIDSNKIIIEGKEAVPEEPEEDSSDELEWI